MPDHPHGELQTYHVKPEDHSNPARNTVTDGTVSDPCKKQAEQTHVCVVLHVWAGWAPPAATGYMQHGPDMDSLKVCLVLYNSGLSAPKEIQDYLYYSLFMWSALINRMFNAIL